MTRATEPRYCTPIREANCSECNRTLPAFKKAWFVPLTGYRCAQHTPTVRITLPVKEVK